MKFHLVYSGWFPQVGHKGAEKRDANMQKLQNFLVLIREINSDFWTVKPWQKRPTISDAVIINFPRHWLQHLGLDGLDNATDKK